MTHAVVGKRLTAFRLHSTSSHWRGAPMVAARLHPSVIVMDIMDINVPKMEFKP
jgi:hypothetical protein